MTDSLTLELIARAQRGSLDDAGELYARFHQRIYRYLFYRIGDPHVAEDLTADVFLRMVQALPTYNPKRTPFQAWLFLVARNLAIDHYRRSAAHPVVRIEENLDSEGQDLDSQLDLRLSTSSLAKALAFIEENQRDVLLLRFIEGMPVAEAAQVLKKSENAVKALQHRGLVALGVILKSQEKEI